MIKIRKDSNKTLFADFCVVLVLSLGSLYSQTIFSILAFLFLSYRVMTKNKEDSIDYILFLSSNTNVFFISAAPACNLVIIVALIKVVSEGRVRVNQLTLAACILGAFELAHIVLYDYFTIIQAIIWVSCLLYVALYCSNCLDQYNNAKACSYFFVGLIMSTVYGCFYRINTGLGFSTDSFNLNDNARFGGGLYDPNYYSMFCLLLFAIIIGHIILKEKRNIFEGIPVWVFLVSIPVLLFFCVAGLSKMFIVVFALLALMTIPVVLIVSNNGRRLFVFILLVVAIGAIAIKYFDYDFISIINKAFERISKANSIQELTSGRSSLISYTWSYLNQHPLALLIGVGIQSYGIRLGLGYVHCFPMELLLTCGIIGTILYVIFLIAIFRVSERAFRTNSVKRLLPFYISLMPVIVYAVCVMSLNIIEVEIFRPLFMFIILNTASRNQI